MFRLKEGVKIHAERVAAINTILIPRHRKKDGSPEVRRVRKDGLLLDRKARREFSYWQNQTRVSIMEGQ